MINGKVKPSYNNFQNELDNIIGNPHEYGLENYFNSLHNTFKNSIIYLQNKSNRLQTDIKSEHVNNQHSIYISEWHNIYPEITILINSYFISLHSELEYTWNKLISMYNNNYSEQITKPKLNNFYFDELNKNKSYKKDFFDEVVQKYSLIFQYNFIRNSLIHQNSKVNCTQTILIQELIKTNELKNVQFNNQNNKTSYKITNIEFCLGYSNLILNFFKSILDTSNGKT